MSYTVHFQSTPGEPETPPTDDSVCVVNSDGEVYVPAAGRRSFWRLQQTIGGGGDIPDPLELGAAVFSDYVGTPELQDVEGNLLVKALSFVSGEDTYHAIQVGEATGRIVIDPLYNGQPFSFGAFAVIDGQTVTEYDPDTVFDGKRANIDYDQFALFTERASAENQTPNFAVPIFSARNFYWDSSNVFAQLEINFNASAAGGHLANVELRRSGDLEATLLSFAHSDSGLLSSLRGVLQLLDIPTANPGVGRKVWSDSGTLKITAAA